MISGEDLPGVAAEVDDRRALVEGGQLRDQREHVGQGQVQVGGLAGLDELELLDHLAHGHRVGVGQHDALGRARWCPTCRRSCRGPRARPLLARRPSSPRSRSRPRARSSSSVSSPPPASIPITCSRSGSSSRTCLDLRQLVLVLADDGAGAGVARAPTRTLRASWWDRPAPRRRRPPRSRSSPASTPPACRPGCRRGRRLDPQVDESQRDLLDGLAHLGIAELAPFAVHLVTAPPAAIAEPLRGRAGQRRHGRSDGLGTRCRIRHALSSFDCPNNRFPDR